MVVENVTLKKQIESNFTSDMLKKEEALNDAKGLNSLLEQKNKQLEQRLEQLDSRLQGQLKT